MGFKEFYMYEQYKKDSLDESFVQEKLGKMILKKIFDGIKKVDYHNDQTVVKLNPVEKFVFKDFFKYIKDTFLSKIDGYSLSMSKQNEPVITKLDSAWSK